MPKAEVSLPGVEVAAGHAAHGVEEHVLEVEQALVLLGKERGELEVLVDLGLLEKLLSQHPTAGGAGNCLFGGFDRGFL